MPDSTITDNGSSSSSNNNHVIKQEIVVDELLSTLNSYVADEAEDYINQNVDVSTIDFRRLLFTAVAQGKTTAYENIAAYIAKNGATLQLDINQIIRSISAENGENLLHVAASVGDYTLCEKLLATDSGINPFWRNYNGFTPADYAYQILIGSKLTCQRLSAELNEARKAAEPDASRIAKLERQLQQVEAYIPQAIQLLQLFVNKQCAIDVTWLAFSNDIDAINKLVLGHVVRDIDITGGHIFNVESLKKRADKLNDEDKFLIKFRLQQFNQVSERAELRAVKQHVKTFLSTSVLRNISTSPEVLDACEPAKNMWQDGRLVVSADCVIPIAAEQNDFVYVNFETFKEQLQILEDTLNVAIKAYEKDIPAHKTFTADDVKERTRHLNIFAVATSALTGTIALSYNFVLGLFAGISAIPVPGQCLDYLQANNTHGQPYNTTTCLDRAPAPPPSLDEQGWEKVETAATWPNVAFATIIGIALLSAAANKVIIKSLEKLSAWRENNRQSVILDEAKVAVEELITTLKNTFPAMSGLLDRLVNPQAATKDTMLQDMKALKEQLRMQRVGILEQGASLKYFPNLGVFRQAPAANLSVRAVVGVDLGEGDPLLPKGQPNKGRGC